MQKLTGVSLGPIFRTIAEAEKTKAVWGASFMFAELAYLIASKIKSLEELGGVQLVLPCGSLPAQEKGYGTYTDRIFFYANYDKEEVGQKIISPALKELAGKMEGVADILEFLQEYLEVTVAWIEQDSSGLGSNLKRLSDRLTAMEYAPSMFSYKENLLQKTLYEIHLTSLYKSQFGSSRRQFVSTEELAGRKYLAIVFCDGDELGSMKSQFSSLSQFELFEKKMRQFVDLAGEEIMKFGGQVIYAGGDDLFFFAPVVSVSIPSDGIEPSGGKQLLRLIADLDKHFNNLFKDSDSSFASHKPGLSFGIHIQYQKAPLYEGIQQARSNLNSRAKRMNWEKTTNEGVIRGKKNTISISYEPHSSPKTIGDLPLSLDWVSYANSFFDEIYISPDLYPSKSLKRYDRMAAYLNIIVEDGLTSNSTRAFFHNTLRSRENHLMKDLENHLVRISDNVFSPSQYWVYDELKDFGKHADELKIETFQFIMRFAGFLAKSNDPDEQ